MNEEKDFRTEIARQVKPYVPGEQLNEQQYIKLNTNEHPYGVPAAVAEKMRELADSAGRLRKYPHPFAEPLRSYMADQYNLPPGAVLVGNGSDEILRLVCQAVLGPGRKVAYSEITYSLYDTLVQMTGAEIVRTNSITAENNIFAIDLDALTRVKAQAVFLPNPNAQTGEYISKQRLARAIAADRGKLWLIDEAYNDFVDTGETSFAHELGQHSNCIVSRTFSKTHGLAGLRIGFGMSQNKSLMQGLYALKDSYNCDMVAIELGLAAAREKEYFNEKTAEIITSRKKLSADLGALGCEVITSQANFLLVKPPGDAEALYQKLKAEKILVRHFKGPLQNYLRISIGTPEENQALLKALSRHVLG